MLYIRLALCVIAASVVFLYLAAVSIQDGNFGNTQPTELSLQQLAGEGRGSNTFVRLSNYSVTGQPVLVQYFKLDNYYIPLFKNVADSNAETQIRVVLKIDSAKADQLPAILAELADPNKRIEGLCHQQLGQTAGHLIQEQYGRSVSGAHVIQYGSTPKLWKIFLGLGIIVIVYTFYLLGTLLVCKSSGKPRTRLDRISMIVTGAVACIIGSFLYYQNAAMSVFATTGLTFAGLGLARMLVGSFALKIKDQLFTGNWFLTNDIRCSDNVLSLRSGRKSAEIPIDDIEAISLVWLEDGHRSVDRNRFSLRLVTREGKLKIKGVILQTEFAKYAREFNLLHEHLEARFWGQLTDGHECSGEGWRLRADKLCLKQRKLAEIEIPTESLAGVCEIEDELRFWVRGNEEHVAALPIDQLNVELLSRCLKRLLQFFPAEELRSNSPATSLSRTSMDQPLMDRTPLDQPLMAADIHSQPQTGLGMIKFTESSKRTGLVWLAGLLLLGLLFCSFDQWLIGLTCVLSIVPAFRVLLTKRTTLRVHEHGISLKRGDELITLAFEDIESVTCKTTSFMNGTHWEGNSHDLQFEGTNDGQRIVLGFASPVSVSDAYLDLVQKASLPIAKRMAEQLRAVEKVEWVPGCFLWTDGLEAPYGTLIKGKARKVGFHLIRDTQTDEDRLRIYTDGKKTAAFILDMSQENFMAGYLLLQMFVEASIDDDKFDEQASGLSLAETVGN